MDHPIHGGGRGHGIFEDLVPLAEDEIAGDQHRPALIAFGQQGEEHFHLFAVLLHIPEVIENERVKAIEPFQFGREAEIAFGREQALDELEGRGKEHGRRCRTSSSPSPQTRWVLPVPGLTNTSTLVA